MNSKACPQRHDQLTARITSTAHNDLMAHNDLTAHNDLGVGITFNAGLDVESGAFIAGRDLLGDGFDLDAGSPITVVRRYFATQAAWV